MRIVTLSVEEFSEMLERAATLGAERALQQLKPEVDTQGVAQMLGVSSRTVARMEARGELPPRCRHAVWWWTPRSTMATGADCGSSPAAACTSTTPQRIGGTNPNDHQNHHRTCSRRVLYVRLSVPRVEALKEIK